MESLGLMWIFAWVLAAFVGVNTDTIVYPGKSALLSYSPARGEFPVQSLFGRGYFSYIDDKGISRTVSLEPNPLLGVRVTDNGELPSDFGSSLEFKKSLSEEIQKQDRLKPIKEFDQNPFEDKLENNKLASFDGLNKMNGVTDAQFSSIASVKLPRVPTESILLYPQTGSAVAENSKPSDYSLGTQLLPQNMLLAFGNIQPSKALGSPAFYPGNPFLPQNPNMLQQINTQTAPLPGQVYLPPSAPVNSGATTIAPSKVPATGSGPSASIDKKPTMSFGFITPSPKPMATIGSSTVPASSIGMVLPASNQAFPPQSLSGQVVPYPMAPNNFGFVSQPSSNVPLLPTQGQLVPYPVTQMKPSFSGTQGVPVAGQGSKPLAPASVLPSPGSFNPGNPFLAGAVISRPTLQQQLFMVNPGNPFLFNNNASKDKPPIWTPTVAIPTPSQFQVNQMNPFLPKPQGIDSKLEIPSIPSLKSQPQLPVASKLDEPIIKPSACDHESATPTSPEQIKDSPEVEQAKREHFRAHELALAELEKASHQSNEHDAQQSESSLQIASATEYSPNDLTASPLIITTAPLSSLDQTKVIDGDSHGALQALPAKLT